MGVSVPDLRLVLELRRTGMIPDGARVIEIGAQQLTPSVLAAGEFLAELAAAFGVQSEFRLDIAPTTQPYNFSENAPPARLLWQWLGCAYSAIDVDGSEGAIPLDLNFDEVPRAMRGQFHLVTNCGTTEHVANQLNAFKIIHELAGPGGMMIHSLPAQGFSNHGLFNYNPKFFWTLARSNGYALLHMGYQGNPAQSDPLPSDIVDYVREKSCTFLSPVEAFKAGDSALTVSLQKRFDIEYVPPVDVPSGASASPALRKRYWTVFDPNAFARIAPTTGEETAGSIFLRRLRRLGRGR